MSDDFESDPSAIRRRWRTLFDLPPVESLGPSPIWDRVSAAVSRLANEPGPAEIVIVTDGHAGGNDLGVREVAEFAAHAGIAAAVPLGDGDEAELARLTDGEFFDVVFDATGNPQAMERGFRFIAHGGRYVLLSIVQGDIRFSDPEFHKREATLLSSRNATMEDFDTVIAAMRAGQVPHVALATHRLALGDLPARFPDLLDPGQGVIKALVEC